MKILQYREDKKCGNKLSVLGLGCMRFPGGIGRIDKEKTEALLLKAYKHGINYYDTAYLYPGSEEVVGEIFAKHSLREKVYIATKLPQALCSSNSDFDKYFNIQKKRLHTGYIDYYLMHNFTDYAQWEKLCGLGIEKWITEKKNSGEIKQIGFSFHGPYSEFIKLLDNYNWDFVQIQFNYINTNYQAGTEGLLYAANKGLPIFIMEPLLGGKLANLPPSANEVFQKVQPGSTGASWGLRFIWDFPGVTLLLSGMGTEAQLEENVKLAETSMPNSLTEVERQAIQEVKAVFNKNYKVPCTGCNYCMPCPKKINIPACFEAYNASYAVGLMSGIQQYMTTIGGTSNFAHYASDCIECGKCESHCPQHIEIRKQLKAVKKRLQFPGTKALLSLARKVMAKRM
ncbi:MAG: aldo/keto reductase [Clostridiales bacterium]|jgi:predicted aldo/keto reductase-like oxidoreductase|nr:aldo/keto reductase [Clostridiales bacterium]